jgi:hypothetical protein
MYQYPVYPQMQQQFTPKSMMNMAGNLPQNSAPNKSSLSLQPGSYQFGSISIKPLQLRAPTNVQPQQQTTIQPQLSTDKLIPVPSIPQKAVEKENLLQTRTNSAPKSLEPVCEVRKVLISLSLFLHTHLLECSSYRKRMEL